MKQSKPYYQTCLDEEYSRRRQRNPRYSLRSFARSLSVNNGALSQILSRKRVPSVRVARQLIQGLGLAGREAEAFLESLAKVQQDRSLKRVSPVYRELIARETTLTIQARDLSFDQAEALGSWYHLAILEMPALEDFRSDAEAVSKRLGISQTEARIAIERLVRLGLMAEDVQGKLRKATGLLATPNRERTTAALRRLQRDLLERSLASLENDPIDERSHTSMTMAIDPELLSKVKPLIENFARTLCSKLETGRRRRVYNFQASLYPLDRAEKIPRRKNKT